MGHFTEEDIQIANKHIKMLNISLWHNYIETTMKYGYTLISEVSHYSFDPHMGFCLFSAGYKQAESVMILTGIGSKANNGKSNLFCFIPFSDL